MTFDQKLRQCQALDLVKADFKIVYEIQDKLSKVEKESAKLRSFSILNTKVEENRNDYTKFKTEIENRLRHTIIT